VDTPEKTPLTNAEIASAPIEREVEVPDNRMGPRLTSDVGIISALKLGKTHIINQELDGEVSISQLSEVANREVERLRNSVCSKVARASKVTGARFTTEGAVVLVNKRVFSVVLVTRTE